ncbi:hypothetical protein [Loigolactobacillus zhaoyuanensis]|nr:hypothetical protein [Loigolactobacillus zhaoyuanensis]
MIRLTTTDLVMLIILSTGQYYCGSIDLDIATEGAKNKHKKTDYPK